MTDSKAVFDNLVARFRKAGVSIDVSMELYLFQFFSKGVETGIQLMYEQVKESNAQRAEKLAPAPAAPESGGS